jgi:threonine dehydrogenase-like Zn-dependent dehydrogenase
MPGTADSDAAAAVALLSVARAAVAALEGAPRDSIEVTGSGLIARQVRTLLGDGSSDGRRREQRTAIVETTGDPSMIVDATRRLVDRGTLVLVGESLGREAEMNLYPDVHVRGLTLAGIPPPLQGDGSQAMTETDSAFVESARRLLDSVSSGTPLSPDAPWYRVEG